jgi:hypothetical protein
MRAVDLARIRVAKNFAVVGPELIGLLPVQVVRLAGAAPI